jgi:PKD repeat protein
VCQTITINNVPTPCEAAFTYTVNGNVAVLTNTSTVGNANAYQSIWYNNGMAVSTQQNTSITFPANGSYNVCLSIQNNDIDCGDQTCQTITINNVPTPCEAAFTYTMNGSTIVFDNNSVTGMNDFNHYTWNFGDNTATSDLANPTHTYATNGTYQVCLLVWNNETNCEDDICQTITIAVEPPVTCEASFVYETNLFTAFFNANNSGTSSGEIVSYQWTFGDGATSDSPTPTHIYAANGTYQVCLTITTNNGCSDERCGNVVIDAGQMNELRINPNTISNGILNMEVTLMNPQHIHIGVFNSVGQDCFNQNTNLPAGNTPLQLYTANTPTGVYIVQILFDNGFSMMQKVLITP